MRRRDRNQESPTNLLSFQDIISSVLCLMVLITLLLALDLCQRQWGTPQPVAAPPSLQKELDALTARRDALGKETQQAGEAIAKLTSGQMITPNQVSDLREKVKAMEASLATMNDRDHSEKSDTSELQGKIQQAQTDIAAVKVQIARMESQMTNLSGSAFGRQALYVECEQKRCSVCEIAPDGPEAGSMHALAQFPGDGWEQDFLRWAQQRGHPDRDAYILLVRPEAAPKWPLLRRALGQLGFEAGWDVWPENRKLLGAAAGGADHG
jgi:septal ring factor EnvC (AmiA/AmiB activator)